jgi:hypothetical protein
MKGIQKMSEVSDFHLDADGEKRWEEGIVRAREVSGGGDWRTFDLLRRARATTARSVLATMTDLSTTQNGIAVSAHHPSNGRKAEARDRANQ